MFLKKGCLVVRRRGYVNWFAGLKPVGLRHQQAGFLIPLALFIVVAAATLGVAMGQMVAGSRSSAILMALNAQALFAADAGVQMAMHKLHYGVDTRAASDTQCTAMTGDTLTLSGEGMAGCRVAVSCSMLVSSTGDVSLYTISSQSVCGTGDYETGRRIRAESYMQNR